MISLLTANVTNCSNTITYIWRKNSVQVGSSQTLVPTGPGLYEVQVTCGTSVPACTDVAQISLACDPMDVTLTATGGQLVTLQSPACNTYTVSWVFNGQAVASSLNYAPILGNGTYTANYTCNQSGSQQGCTDTATYTCNTGANITSSGLTLSANATGCTSYIYQWYTGTITIGSTPSAQLISGATSATYTPPQAGTYSVLVSCADSGCRAVSTFNYTVICAGFDPTYTVSGGQFNVNNPQCPTSTYAWTYNNTPVGGNNAFFTPSLGNGNYVVTVTCGDGLYEDCVDTNTFNCNVTTTIQNNGTSLTAAPSGCGTYAYSWTGPNGFSATTSSIVPQVNGTYSLQVTCLDSGCISSQVSEDFQDCNDVNVSLVFLPNNVIGYNASGCGFSPTVQWTITPPSGSPIVSSGPTVTVPTYSGDTTVQLNYSCKGCPLVTLTHTIVRRTVAYSIKNFNSNVTIKGLTINGTDYISSNVTTSLTQGNANFTSLITSLQGQTALLSQLGIPSTAVYGANPGPVTNPGNCSSQSGSQSGAVIRFEGALIEGFNTSNVFGPLEFDYAPVGASNPPVVAGGTALVYPAYYVNLGSGLSLAKRTATASPRVFTTTVTLTGTYQNNNVVMNILTNSWSLNTLSNGCHSIGYPSGGYNLVNNSAGFVSAVNAWLSNNGGGTCSVVPQGNGVYTITMTNVLAPPAMISRDGYSVTEIQVFSAILYSFTEI